MNLRCFQEKRRPRPIKLCDGRIVRIGAGLQINSRNLLA
jgi:hypothetical protein